MWGILFVFITPPFQAPDEDLHFYRAFHVSEGNIKASLRSGTAGGHLPRSLEDTVKVFSGVSFFHKHKQKIGDIISAAGRPLDSEDRVFINLRAMARLSPVAYIPQALGIMLGRLFDLPVLILMYLGRIFNLLFWILVMRRAIKNIPLLKWGVLLLALMPMSLFLASSLSADAMTNALSFLLIAVFLRCAFDKGVSVISRRELAVLFLYSGLAALSKPYLFLALLFLLIPREKFCCLRSYLKVFFSLLFTGIVVQGIWCFTIRELFVSIRAGVEALPHISLVVFDPLKYLAVLIGTLYANGFFYADSFIGRLGWLDTPLPLFLVISYYAVLILVPVLERPSGITIHYRQRVVALITALAGFIFVFTSQYLSYTPLWGDIIEGVQGRYFIPFAPVLFLILYNGNMPFNIRRYAAIVTGYAVFALSYTLVVLACRYYLPVEFYNALR
ncbi:MAG: DUF2142 domain-containing protein [Candidatus Omnitrophica bacterium]|nr:DUF2142 domain-containing protein [Candidatus Omnitrophota bacterium]